MLVLKIIGFVLLGILALVLLIVGLVLFVPIRYKAVLKKNDEEFLVTGEAAWLLKLIKIEVCFNGLTKELQKSGRIAFYKLFQEKEDSEKDSVEKKKKPKHRKTSKQEGRQNVEKSEKENQKDDEAAEVLQKISCENEEKESEFKEGSDRLPENSEIEPGCDEGSGNGRSESISDIREESDGGSEKGSEEQGSGSKKHKEKRKKTQKDNQEITFLTRLKNLYLNRDRVESAYYKKRTYVLRAWKRAKRLVIHVLPTKIWGSLELGFDDPATTGKVLGALAMLYAKMGPLFKVTPYFDQKVLVADLKIKGRIRIFTVLLLAGLVYFDKELRKLYKYYKKLSEGEKNGR